MNQTSDVKKGLGCLILFALPFVGVGVYMGYGIVDALSTWAAMRSWEEVPAEILTAELETNQSSESTSYEARATYRYTYDGSDFTGHRVSLHEGSDSVGHFQEDTYRELAAHRGGVFRCYVNTRRPTESVLYRSLRWELLGFYFVFVITFGGAGFGLIVGGVYGSRKAAREAALKAASPDAPWLHKQAWRAGRVRSSTKAALVMSAVFAVFWNAVSSPMLFLAREKIFDRDNPAALLALVFPVVGVGLIVWALRNLARFLKFGESIFEMRSVPGVVGGRLEGTILTRVNLRPDDGFHLVLSSIRRVRTGRGKNRSTRETVLWQRSMVLERESAPLELRRSVIPVSFRIPYECEPTDERDADNQVVWRLELKAELPGVDYYSQFEVPVFRTADSSADYEHDRGAEEQLVQNVDLATKLRQAGIVMELLPSGKRYVFPMARRVGAALGLTGFFVVWTGIVVALFYSDAPRLFPWVFGAFDALILMGMLDVWFYRSWIDVRPGEIVFQGGVFGMGSTRRFVKDQVDTVRPKREMQSGNQLYYQLDVVERGGGTYVAAKRLPDLETAEQLARDVLAVLGR